MLQGESSEAVDDIMQHNPVIHDRHTAMREQIAAAFQEGHMPIGLVADKEEKVQDVDEDQNRLLSLPAELRTRIWRLLVLFEPECDPLVDHRITVALMRARSPAGSPHQDCKPETFGTAFRYPPAVLRVCRQVRSEALPIYYGANEFYGRLSLDDLGTRKRSQGTYKQEINSWLAKIGKQGAGRIKHLNIILPPRRLYAITHADFTTGISRKSYTRASMLEFLDVEKYGMLPGAIHLREYDESFTLTTGLS
ncbi:hypothetical protein LTR53_014897 [Teratosphaeriaceae sp. CCFEE 6253]|nr:hypothetical protein LTR53_014897 [Teratosphaeriaceae sp. CCFEE 6253]